MKPDTLIVETARSRVKLAGFPQKLVFQCVTLWKLMKVPKRFDQKKEVRKLARERVGSVPASRVIVPKTRRNKPKHPKQDEFQTDA